MAVATRKYEHGTPNADRPNQKACEQCGALYTPKKAVQRFCKPVCRVANWNESHPRIDLGGMKLQKGDKRPTAEQLKAAGFRIKETA